MPRSPSQEMSDNNARYREIEAQYRREKRDRGITMTAETAKEYVAQMRELTPISRTYHNRRVDVFNALQKITAGRLFDPADDIAVKIPAPSGPSPRDERSGPSQERPPLGDFSPARIGESTLDSSIPKSPDLSPIQARRPGLLSEASHERRPPPKRTHRRGGRTAGGLEPEKKGPEGAGAAAPPPPAPMRNRALEILRQAEAKSLGEIGQGSQHLYDAGGLPDYGLAPVTQSKDRRLDQGMKKKAFVHSDTKKGPFGDNETVYRKVTPGQDVYPSIWSDRRGNPGSLSREKTALYPDTTWWMKIKDGLNKDNELRKYLMPATKTREAHALLKKTSDIYKLKNNNKLKT